MILTFIFAKNRSKKLITISQEDGYLLIAEAKLGGEEFLSEKS